jgi:putative Holliday junction resolvase
MRVLALDYGEARCGCALSDPTGTLATPLPAIERPGTRRGLARIVSLVEEREVERIVVGLPVGLSGDDTEQTAETREFAARLGERVNVPVELYDERFTTRIAQRRELGGRERGRRGGLALADEDSRAAAVLLEGWLAR